MESADHSQPCRENLKRQHGRRLRKVLCRDVGPLLKEFLRCGTEQPHSEAHLQLGDTLGLVVGMAQASSGLGKATDPGTAHKAFDAPEGFHRCHYKLRVYTAYCNYRLPYLQWSLENQTESPENKMRRLKRGTRSHNTPLLVLGRRHWKWCSGLLSVELD